MPIGSSKANGYGPAGVGGNLLPENWEGRYDAPVQRPYLITFGRLGPIGRAVWITWVMTSPASGGDCVNVATAMGTAGNGRFASTPASMIIVY